MNSNTAFLERYALGFGNLRFFSWQWHESTMEPSRSLNWKHALVQYSHTSNVVHETSRKGKTPLDWVTRTASCDARQCLFCRSLESGKPVTGPIMCINSRAMIENGPLQKKTLNRKGVFWQSEFVRRCLFCASLRYLIIN